MCRLLSVGLALAIAIIFADPAWSADPSPAGKSEQPSILKLKAELGLWTLVVFGLLLFILSKTAWPRILEGLRKREEAIVQARDEAQRARDEAQKYLAEVKAQLEKAHQEANQILDEARRDASRLREEEKARTLAELAQESERARREIATARDQALQEVYQQVVQLSILASAKAIGRELQINEGDQRRLIDEAIVELRQQTTDRVLQA
jgi:F-type H+-transporting ATPase subunit b